MAIDLVSEYGTLGGGGDGIRIQIQNETNLSIEKFQQSTAYSFSESMLKLAIFGSNQMII